MRKKQIHNIVGALAFLCLTGGSVWAQSPKTAYYYNPNAEFPFAECYVFLQGGSRVKIPFLPVVDRSFKIAPMGTNNYAEDVRVESPLVFIGNGIVEGDLWNSYLGRKYNYTQGEIDVSGKAVLFCYDFPGSIESQLKGKQPLTKRIAEAASRDASAVILFSWKTDHPFLTVNYEKRRDVPDIPVITITKGSAVHILQSSGFDEGVFKKWEETGKPISAELISRIGLNIQGRFERVETDHFLICFRREEFSPEKMEKLAQMNEKSLEFLFETLKDSGELTWKKQMTLYFRDFDSKFFYTRHAGWGGSSNECVYSLFLESGRDYSLAVHENTHTLTYLNWTDESTSFMDEGIAKFTEALVSEKDKNHLVTIKYLKEGKLFSLEEMTAFHIGIPGLKTTVGYPASGSYAGFLIENYGLKRFKEAFIFESRPLEERKRESSWKKAYGKSLLDLEREWLDWLGKKFQVDEKTIQAHLEQVEKKTKARLSKKDVTLSVEDLKKYVGSYLGKEMGRRVIIKQSEGRLVLTTPDAPGFESSLQPEGNHRFKMEGGPAGGEKLVFSVDETGEAVKVCIRTFCFEKE